MAFDYDTIVIGGGPGGLAVAYGLNSQQKVLAILKRCFTALLKLKDRYFAIMKAGYQQNPRLTGRQ